MQAYPGNLLAANPPAIFSSADFFGFDLVVISMALHLFDDPLSALKLLSSRLKAGGTLVVIDNVPQQSLDEFAKIPGSHIKHGGFDQAQMESWLSEAGIGKDTEYVPLQKGPSCTIANGMTFELNVFIAKGVKL